VELANLIIASIIIGGLAGTAINMLATRLPAEGDPSPVGPPLRPASQQGDTLAFVPYAGAWMPSVRAVDWPKLGTDIAAALVTALAFALNGAGFDGIRAATFSLILLLILRIDWQNHLIFTVTIGPSILLALGFQALDSAHALMVAAIAGGASALAFLALYMAAILIYKKRALGFGDVLLAALIGAMTGAEAPGALLIGMILGAVGGLVLVAIRVRTTKDYIPYGAYLCLGAILAIIL
jgi:leader peptidase (prepilin peptidase)/N-methyltransferase